MHNAAKFGKVEIIKLLLERRARGDLIDYEGTTPVHFSMGRGCDCLAVLLRHGACFAIRDKQGLTVWHLATQENSFRAFGVLKDYVVDRSPDSPLATKLDPSSLVTTSTSMKQSCTILRGYYNTKSGDGFTPLRIAIEAGSLGAFRYLIENGSDSYALKGDDPGTLHCAVSGRSLMSPKLLCEDRLSLIRVANPACRLIAFKPACSLE